MSKLQISKKYKHKLYAKLHLTAPRIFHFYTHQPWYVPMFLPPLPFSSLPAPFLPFQPLPFQPLPFPPLPTSLQANPPSGRQTPHPTTTGAAPSALHRHRPRRHHQARMDLQHPPRQLRVVHRTPAFAGVYGCGDGGAAGEGQGDVG